MSRPPHPIEIALAAHAKVCRDLTITRIVGEPDFADALNLADDLEIFAASADAVVEAFGAYAASTLGLSRAAVETHFRDQLRTALEGNATYELTHGWGINAP